MTLPTIIQRQQEKVTVNKLKKMNSILNNAFISAVEEFGTPDNWDIIGRPTDDSEESEAKYSNSIDNVMNKFLPYLKTTFVCYYSDLSCRYLEKYKRKRYALVDQGGDSIWDTPRMILADGSSIDTLFFGGSGCRHNWGTSKALKNACGEIVVDVNGIKPPNAQGKDIFFFYLTKYGVVPAGLEYDTVRPFEHYCNLGSTSAHNGYGCTAWVIYNENMDYLRCKDLSWSGKKKCGK